jgi:hypothetical protein
MFPIKQLLSTLPPLGTDGDNVTGRRNAVPGSSAHGRVVAADGAATERINTVGCVGRRSYC